MSNTITVRHKDEKSFPFYHTAVCKKRKINPQQSKMLKMKHEAENQRKLKIYKNTLYLFIGLFCDNEGKSDDE